MLRRLATEPLTKAGFAAFGDVIEADGAERLTINAGTAERLHDLADIDVSRDGGHPLFSIFRATPWPQPVAIRMMERHPLGSQAFYPLSDEDWIVVVCEGREAPDPATLRCFRASGRQGVNFRPNTWHHPLLVLAPQAFVVIDRGGPGDNLDERQIPPSEGHYQVDFWEDRND